MISRVKTCSAKRLGLPPRVSKGCKVVARQLASSLLSRLQRAFRSHLLESQQEAVLTKLLGKASQYGNQLLEGEVEDLPKGHVRAFQELVFPDASAIHDNRPPAPVQCCWPRDATAVLTRAAWEQHQPVAGSIPPLQQRTAV